MTTVALSPLFNGQQFFDNNGNMLSGGQLGFYVANSSSVLQNIYADNLGTIPLANPIVLNSSGRYNGEIWLDTTLNYNVVIYQSDGISVISSYNNVAGIAATLATSGSTEWGSVVGGTATEVTTTQISNTGNYLSTYTVNRRVKVVDTGGTWYGYVASVSGPNPTVVNIVFDSGAMAGAGTAQVYVGILNATVGQTSYPQQITTQLATLTANVASINSSLSGLAPIASPTFTGSVHAPTVVATTFTGAIVGSGAGLTGIASALTAGAATYAQGATYASAFNAVTSGTVTCFCPGYYDPTGLGFVGASFSTGVVTSPMEILNMRIMNAGNYTINCTLTATTAGEVAMQIYKDGIAFGSLINALSSTGSVAYTQNLTFSAFDTLQLFLWSAGTAIPAVTNFTMGTGFTQTVPPVPLIVGMR